MGREEGRGKREKEGGEEERRGEKVNQLID